MDAGQTLLENGGEVFRAQQTMEIMAASQLVNTVVAVCLIGLTTFTISCIGVKAGSVFGARYKSKAEFVGGAILILIGIKILLEHLGVL